MQHKDLICRLFTYTFIGKASTWFFSLSTGSITSWKQFKTTFITQFGDDKTYGVLFLELSRINFSKNENIKDFNQRFINILNWISDKPAKLVHIEFYTVALPPLVEMLVKGKEKRTLVENILEAIKLEKYLEAISSN